MSSLPSSAAPVARRPRRRAARLGALAAMTALTLAGCKVDNTPASYEAKVNDRPVIRDNFVATCTGRIPGMPTTTLVASEDVCVCKYDVMTKNVPYSDKDKKDNVVAGYPEDKASFQHLEELLKNDPGAITKELPQSVQDKLNGCKPAAVGPVAPAGSVPPATDALR